MNHRRFFALVAAACALVSATRATANELMNPGFELDAVMGQDPLYGATGWTPQGTGTPNTTSAPADPVRTGIGSMQIVGGGGYGVPLIVQTFPASPGQQWDLQGYMLQNGNLPAGNSFGLLKIVFDDGAADLQIPAGNVVVGQADAPAFPGIVTSHVDSTTLQNTWVFAHAAGIAPPGTVDVRLYALVVDENPATAYFDDLQGLLAGDFENDLDIDGADLPIWKTAFGLTALGDADGDGDSDGADFLLWQRGLHPPAAVAAVGAVPEPSAIGLACLGLCCIARCARRTESS